MVMDIMEIRLLGPLGIIVVGLVTTVGTVVVSLLSAGAVHTSLAIAGFIRRLRDRAAGVRAGRAPSQVADRGFHLEQGDHALLARQAWWRLRC
jgi:hypothetical protein